ncbi:hypothetical protein RI367_001564 [Sorochytrium milnesiophthora]
MSPPSASLNVQSLSLTNRQHVLLVAAGQLGHLIPSVELAIQLVRVHGCRVSLLTSKVAVATAQRRNFVPSEYAHLLQLVPRDDGAEASDEIKFDFKLLVQNFERSNEHFDQLARVIRTRNDLPGDKASQSDLEVCPLPDARIDHIIVELFVGFAVEHVRDLGVPVTGLWPNSPRERFERLQRLDQAPDPATAQSSSPPKTDGNAPEEPKKSEVPAWMIQAMGRVRKVSDLIWSCERVVVNTFDGLEDDMFAKLRALPALRNTKVYTVGPLSLCGRKPINDGPASTADVPTAPATPSPNELYATAWLDKQHAAGRPVVYISHGSQAELNAEQVAEMAQALDKIKTHASIVWAMRPAQQATLPPDARSAIDIFNTSDTHAPSSAEVLVMGWAPQVTILAHPATKVFLTHCGWNSTVEAMSNGVPVVAWPLFADQHSNTAMVSSAEVQMGVAIPGTTMMGEGRLVPCDEIVDAVHQVLGDGKEPSVYARNAARLGQIARAAVQPGTGSTMKNLYAFLTDAASQK